MMNVYIGFDPRQPIAFCVAAHSIWENAEMPVAVAPVKLSQLPLKRRGLTEFTYSRFLVPYLSNYEGVSLFMDSDTMARADVNELLAYAIAYPDIPVWVVKGQLKFEWASVMVFNNKLCRNLTPQFVEDPANKLFDLGWAEKVGELPKEWNFLVGYDTLNPKAKIVHFTQGIPIWSQTKDCNFSTEWLTMYKNMNSSVPFQELMGASVHVAHMK